MPEALLHFLSKDWLARGNIDSPNLNIDEYAETKGDNYVKEAKMF